MCGVRDAGLVDPSGERTVQAVGSDGEDGLIEPGTVVLTHAIMVRAFVDDIEAHALRHRLLGGGRSADDRGGP
ncbi:hypothetical protein [Streptomyces sp. NPDC057325]|uniref:hypothetical protein n=1 Tax=unclassified Streptomyces TaxID=2593676 RepID=UPI003634F95D